MPALETFDSMMEHILLKFMVDKNLCIVNVACKFEIYILIKILRVHKICSTIKQILNNKTT